VREAERKICDMARPVVMRVWPFRAWLRPIPLKRGSGVVEGRVEVVVTDVLEAIGGD
jgi:hypothetical protein